jgi:hypothetical protein
MKVSEYRQMTPTVNLPETLDPSDPNAVEKYLFGIILHANKIETQLNEGRAKGQKLNRFVVTISEDGTLRAGITAQADLASLRLL